MNWAILTRERAREGNAWESERGSTWESNVPRPISQMIDQSPALKSATNFHLFSFGANAALSRSWNGSHYARFPSATKIKWVSDAHKKKKLIDTSFSPIIRLRSIPLSFPNRVPLARLLLHQSQGFPRFFQLIIFFLSPFTKSVWMKITFVSIDSFFLRL